MRETIRRLDWKSISGVYVPLENISNRQRRREEGSGVDLEAVAFDALVEMFDVETGYVSSMAKRGSVLKQNEIEW